MMAVPFLLFLTHVVVLYHLSNASSLTFLSSVWFVKVIPLSTSRIVPSILNVRQSRGLSLWWGSCCRACFQDVFSFVRDTLLKNSFLTCSLVWWCPLSKFPSTCKFLFLREFGFFLDLVVLSFYSLESFSQQDYWVVFLWSLSDSKSPQVFRILLSILAYLNNGVVWMVFICSLISKSSILLTNPLVTVPSAPIAIGITNWYHQHFPVP